MKRLTLFSLIFLSYFSIMTMKIEQKDPIEQNYFDLLPNELVSLIAQKLQEPIDQNEKQILKDCYSFLLTCKRFKKIIGTDEFKNRAVGLQLTWRKKLGFIIVRGKYFMDLPSIY